jgi:hypothetical protein
MSVRRSLAVAALTVGLLAGAAASALADTTGGNTDRLSAAASWADASGSGSASVAGFSDPAEGTFVEYSYVHDVEFLCEDGSSGFGSVDFFGQSEGTLTIDKKLGTAAGAGTVTGTQNTFDWCTGETTSVEASYAIEFSLTATAAASTVVTRTKETAPDGTKVIVTTSITNRQATGSVRIDGGSAITPDSGEIQHIVVTTKAR